MNEYLFGVLMGVVVGAGRHGTACRLRPQAGGLGHPRLRGGLRGPAGGVAVVTLNADRYACVAQAK